MTEQKIEVSELFTEMAMGSPVVGAFILSRLEAEGLLDHEENLKGLKKAVDLIPENMHGIPGTTPWRPYTFWRPIRQ